MPQISLGWLMLAGVFGGILGFAGVMLMQPEANMYMSPEYGWPTVGEEFTVDVVVTANIPVNVFKADLKFNPDILKISSINYNTSIADLWAEEPWYSNGEGTMNFIGGTTRSGGFIGTGNLVTIKFETLDKGRAEIAFSEIRILKHDGLGTDAVIAEPIDAIFSIESEMLKPEVVLEKSSLGSAVSVINKTPDTDLNNDGKQSAADLSIFMSDLVSQNKRSDFNEDGKISTADLSIIMNAN